MKICVGRLLIILTNMEDEIREIIEQVDASNEIPDARREELIAALKERFPLPPGIEMAVLESNGVEPVFAPDDWRGRAAYHASRISKDLNT